MKLLQSILKIQRWSLLILLVGVLLTGGHTHAEDGDEAFLNTVLETRLSHSSNTFFEPFQQLAKHRGRLSQVGLDDFFAALVLYGRHDPLVAEYLREIGVTNPKDFVKHFHIEEVPDTSTLPEIEGSDTVGFQEDLNELIIETAHRVGGEGRMQIEPHDFFEQYLVWVNEKRPGIDSVENAITGSGMSLRNFGDFKRKYNQVGKSKETSGPSEIPHVTNLSETEKQGADYSLFVGRDEELGVIQKYVWGHRHDNKVLVIGGKSGVGRTELLKEVARKDKERQYVFLNIHDVAYYERAEQRVAELQKVINALEQKKDHVLVIDGMDQLDDTVSNSLLPLLKNVLSSFPIVFKCDEQGINRFMHAEGGLDGKVTTLPLENLPKDDVMVALERQAKFLESELGVEFEEGVFERAVDFSTRYLTHQAAPGNAISLLRQTAISIAYQADRQSKNRESGPAWDEFQKLQIEYDQLVAEKTRQSTGGSRTFTKENRLVEVMSQLGSLRAKHGFVLGNKKIVQVRDVIRAGCRVVQIPEDMAVAIATGSTRKYKQALRSKIRKRVFGQDEAVDKVLNMDSSYTRKGPKKGSLAGLAFFAGESQTGKSFIVETYTELRYGKNRLLKINAGQLLSPHELASIFGGASTGYVGYEDGSQMSNAHKRGIKVFLFDEVDKMPKDVQKPFWHSMMEIMMTGTLTLNKGDAIPIDLSDCMIVFTSNYGSGFHNMEVPDGQDRREFLDNTIKQELLSGSGEASIFNRIRRYTGDERPFTYFEPLPDDVVLTVLRQEIKEQFQQPHGDPNGSQIVIDSTAQKELERRLLRKSGNAADAASVVKDMEEAFISAIDRDPSIDPEEESVQEVRVSYNGDKYVFCGSSLSQLATKAAGSP